MIINRENKSEEFAAWHVADELAEKEVTLQDNLESAQTSAVLHFMLFLNETLSRTSHHFEQETLCSPEEANIIDLLSKRGPLMVKEISQALIGIDHSKLTRILDSLEKQGYATRTLNQEDRRSFLITPTEQGKQLLAMFTAHLHELAQGMLVPLTPAERLILIELFTKIEANGFRSLDV